MKKFRIVLGAAAVLGCLTLSSCGKETFNVTETMELNFSGYNGYGTCSLENQYEWTEDIIEWYGDSITEREALNAQRELYDVVEYKIDNEKELSNGDTVTVTVKIGKAAEDYAFNLEGKEMTFTVEGLEEVKEVDPFENVSVIFEGKAPNGTAKLNNNSGDYTISYKMDKENGLSNGDTVTLTASYGSGNEELYVRQYGKKLSVAEKTYTVEGLSSYPKTISEISSDMMEKMKKQAEDTVTAYCSGWDEGNSLASLELIGNYYLNVKEGFYANPNNCLFFVFKATANMTGLYEEDFINGDDSIKTGTDEFYTYVSFSEIINLPDGTTSVDLSRAEMTGNRVDSNYGYYSFFGTSAYTFNGYKDLDSMFNDCITKNIEKYDYENTVK